MTKTETEMANGSRVVLITGASRGIGRALAGRLASEGCSLGLMARSNDDLERLAGQLRTTSGTRLMLLPCDIRDAGAAEDAVERFFAREQRLDAAVLCAGVLGEMVPVGESDPVQWVDTLAVNLNGSYFAARAAVRVMRRTDPRPGAEASRGRVLFVSSGAGRPPRSPWGAYAVSKYAVDGLMTLMAAEARETGVLAASVNPGGTATQMRAQAYPAEDPSTLPTAAQVADVFARLLHLPGEQFNGQLFNAAEWLASPGAP